MLNLNNQPTPTLGDLGQLVVVSKHDFDWETSAELLDATEARLQSLGAQLLHGAWFLNPRFTVQSPAVSGEFFGAARHSRSRWLKEVRGSISLRREARSVVAHARQVALSDLDLAEINGPSASPLLATLTPEQRKEALVAGHIARQMTFSGLMIIDGDHVLPRTWNEMADELLGPEPTSKGHLRRQRVDPASP